MPSAAGPFPKPEPVAPRPRGDRRDDLEARAQDLDYLARLTSGDRSFTPRTAGEFRRRVARLREDAASLDRTTFLLGASEAVAAAGNAHTNVDLRDWREQLASLPVRFEWFAEGLHVVRATNEAVELLGARVLAIDGLEPQALGAEGAPAWRRIVLDLPNSKLKVTTSTAFHDWAHGCRELRCFWPNVRYDVAVGSVDPDVAVAWRFADYRRGVDTVLQRTLER